MPASRSERGAGGGLGEFVWYLFGLSPVFAGFFHFPGAIDSSKSPWYPDVCCRIWSAPILAIPTAPGISISAAGFCVR